MIDIEKLRAICQAAGPHSPIAPWAEFRSTITPATVLAMCDEIERLRVALNKAASVSAYHATKRIEAELSAPSIAARREEG